MTINEILLFHFTQDEIERMSQDERISIAADISDEMEIGRIEREYMVNEFD